WPFPRKAGKRRAEAEASGREAAAAAAADRRRVAGLVVALQLPSVVASAAMDCVRCGSEDGNKRGSQSRYTLTPSYTKRLAKGVVSCRSIVPLVRPSLQPQPQPAGRHRQRRPCGSPP